jgi:soluble lytic murein transglycosylase-like protein
MRICLVIACMVGGLLGTVARADVWARVDAQGRIQFASEQADEGFELYYRDALLRDTTPAAAVPMAPSRLFAFFEISPSFLAVRPVMRDIAQALNLDFALLQALIATESGFNANAVSPRGAVGLMQVTEPMARSYGLTDQAHQTVHQQLLDPITNLRIGSLALREMLRRFSGRADLAVAAYNAGPRRVKEAGNQVPDIVETQKHVRTVMAMYRVLKAYPTSGNNVNVASNANQGLMRLTPISYFPN